MASIRENALSGDERSWTVLYRHGKKQSSQTYIDQNQAEEFRDLVNLIGPDRALKAMQVPEGAAALITVSELAGQWLAWKQGRVTSRTHNDYTRDVANWIDPWFGHRAAEHVDESDVQKWVEHMEKKLDAKTVVDRHSLLHQMYEWGKAKSRRLVEHNPCKETELPARKKKPPKGTTTVEFRAILAATNGNIDAHDLILFIGETGWRFSEATALAVRDVEDDGTDVWVNMTRVFRVDSSSRQYIAEDEAKSDAGFRRIRMLPDTAAMLRRRVVGKGIVDFVFTNHRGGHWNQTTFLRDTWPAILRRAGLTDKDGEPIDGRKPTPHWLRHMHVAVCLAAGAGMQEVQRRIGHEHYSTTADVYGGMIGDISTDAIERAAALMSGQATAQKIAPVVVGEVVIVQPKELGGSR